MHKQNAATLLVVLRKPNSSKWQEYAEDLLLFDHVLHILPCDLVGSRSEANLGQLLYKVYIVDGLKEIAIISDRGTSRQLAALLDALLPLLKSDGALSVAGFKVSASAFARMIHSCEQVALLACQLSGQWQKSSSPAAKCKDLSIKHCSGSTPKGSSIGQSAWPALRSILIWENWDLPALSPHSYLQVDHPASIECDSELTKSLVRCLWGPGISDLHISGSQDLSWITELHPSKALKSVWFGGSSVSEDVFRWVLRNRCLRALTLSWEQKTRLPWQGLAQLKRLRLLDISDTHLDDDQLEAIARASHLRTVQACYTSLTGRAWKTILAWPGLESFWGSQEIVDSQCPDDLPASTDLKECVALNANTDQYRSILARYPCVEVVEL